MVREDCVPKNIVNKKGYEAVIAGDMVSPVKINVGSKIKMINKYLIFYNKQY